MTHSARRIADLAISESGFVFDPQSGDVFTVNPTGREILNMLKDGLPQDLIVEHLEALFTVDGEDVARDVAEFIGLLEDHRLIQGERS